MRIPLLAVLGAALTTALLVGCGSETRNLTTEYKIPPELNDCTIHRIGSETRTELTVMRCPNSTTSTTMRTSNGKTSRVEDVTLIDGVPYVKKESVENGTN